MGFWDKTLRVIGLGGAVEQRSLEDPQWRSSGDPNELLAMLGLLDRRGALPRVSIEAALGVPAVWSIVNFLSRTLASLPLHTFEAGENGAKFGDGPAQLLSRAPNEETTSFDWRRQFWGKVFTGGRGLSWIERQGRRPVAIHPLNAAETTIERKAGATTYRYDGKVYAAADIIDTPFMLKPDGLTSYSPIGQCNLSISVAIAMGDFAGGFFAGGGMPPHVLEGPMPSGAEAIKRAQADIQRSIEAARQEQRGFFAVPVGHSLKPLGTDPSKGQMVEARLFQVQEIARIWQVPPAFVQDLSKGTFSNTEQQDLQLVKHLILHWATQFEQQLTLKLYGFRSADRVVKHNLDGLQRGAFKDRIEALARGVMTGQLTPNEARALEQRPPQEGGDQLYIQQATVPLTSAGMGHNGGPPLKDNNEEDDGDGGSQSEE